MEARDKIERMAKLAGILTKYGFADLLHRLKDKLDLPAGPVQHKKKDLADYPFYARIRMVLEEMGCTYVKLGQLLSTRDDIVPPGLIRELQQLQDHVDAVPIDIKELFKEEFHINLAETFSSVNETPFAAASMSQVYRATLKAEGRKIAIKVKRPGIDQQVQTDLAIIKEITTALGPNIDFIKGLHLPSFIDSFEYSMRQELSFVHERVNLMRFAANFSGSEDVYAIQCFDNLSNDHILSMELIEKDCIKIDDVKAISKAGFDPSRIAIQGLNCYLDQIFKFGFFHGDPHPGNIFLRPDGKLVFIDFGNMGMLLHDEQQQLEKLLIYFSEKDIPKLTATLEKMAVNSQVESEDRLQRQLAEMVALVDNTPIENLNVKMIFDNLKGILRDNKVELPGFMYLLIRGITLLEGIGKTLDPKISIPAVIQPYAQGIIEKKLSIPDILSEVGKKIRLSGEIIQQLPEDIMSLITNIRDNKITINHRVEGLDTTTTKVRNSLDRLALSIILTALSIASAILVYADRPPKLWHIPILSLVGFIISAVIGRKIVISILRKRSE